MEQKKKVKRTEGKGAENCGQWEIYVACVGQWE
jgi:hypothetical protein